MKNLFLIVILLLSGINTYAQYTGGIGDGYAAGSKTNIPRLIANAGNDTTICFPNETINITVGTAVNPVGKSFSWNLTGNTDILGTMPQYEIAITAVGVFKYVLTVDSLGCKETDTITVTVNPTPVITSIVSNCTGSTLNSVTVNASTTSGSLEYSCNGGGFQNSCTFIGLNMGTSYTFVVRVVGSTCTATSTHTPSCPCPVILNNNISEDQEICSGEIPAALTGLVPTVNPNTASFSYQWQSNPISPDTWQDLGTNRNQTLGALQTRTKYRRLIKISGCPNDTSNVITITVNPKPGTPAIPSGILIRCQGGGTSEYTSLSTDATAYNWTITGEGNTISGNGTSATVTWNSIFTGTAIISVTASNDCGTSVASTVNVIVNPIPEITSIISNCTGETLNSVTVNANVVPSGTLEYSCDGSEFNTNNTFSNLNQGIEYTFVVRVTETNCTATKNYAPICFCPDISNNKISEHQVMCSGDSAKLLTGSVPTVIPNASFNYQWQSSPTGTDNWNDLSSAIEQNYSSGKLSVNTSYRRLIKISGCPDNISNVINVIVIPLPIIAEIKGTTALCMSKSEVLSNDTLGGEWTISDDKIISISEMIIGKIEISGLKPGTCTVTYTVTNENGCKNSVSEVITVNPLPTPKILGNNPVCAGETVTYTLENPASGSSYQWSIEGGTAQAPFNSNSVVVIWGTSSIGKVKVIETIDATGCSDSNELVITINPLPTIKVDSITLSEDKKTYTVSVKTGTGKLTTTAGDINGREIQSIPISKSVTITITDNNCSNSITVTPPDTNCPEINAPISAGDIQYCAGEPIPPIIVTVESGLTVDWYDEQNILLDSETISYHPESSGTYYAVARDAVSNCISRVRTAIIVKENPKPTPKITGNNSVCVGEAMMYKVEHLAEHGYRWSAEDGTAILSDSKNNEVKIAFNKAGVSTLHLTETIGATGCDSTTSYSVVVNPLPEIAPIEGAARIDVNDTRQYKNEFDGGIWSSSDESIASINSTSGDLLGITSGDVTITYTIVDPRTGCKNQVSKAVSVAPHASSTISLGSSSANIGDTVLIPLILDESNNLIKDGDTLSFTAIITYNPTILSPIDYTPQTIISDIEAKIEIPGICNNPSGELQSIKFLVLLGNDTCSPVFIESFVWDKPNVKGSLIHGKVCVEDICKEGGTRLYNPNGEIKIYSIAPTPASDIITIEFSIAEKGETKLELYNALGVLIKSIPISTETVGKKTEIISLENVGSGQYFLILKTPEEKITKQIPIVK